MRNKPLARRQQFILSTMTLTLVVVLVALGSLVRRGIQMSPLATAVPSTLEPTGTNAPEVAIGATATPHALPRSTTSGKDAELLAARRIEQLDRAVAQIRELPKQQEIPLNFISVEEIAGTLRRALLDSERAVYLQEQQALLAALGLMPSPGQVFPQPVQTRARHIVAFFDPIQAQIFIGPSGRASEPPDISLVHQYAHAYIDQHFDLLSVSEGATGADALRARDALIEGDAMAVAAHYGFGSVDQADLDVLADHLVTAEPTDYEGYFSSRAMRGVFVFPYLEGTRFVGAVLQAGWWPAVNAAYLDPPASTEQILHPEKYIDSPRDVPRAVNLPDVGEELGGGWRLVAQDVLGELVLRAHLDQYLPDTQEAVEAASGWDGDRAHLWQDIDGREILIMRVLWDDAIEAEEFERNYVKLIDRRLRQARIVRTGLSTRGGRLWLGETGTVVLRRDGATVLVIWATGTNMDIQERVLEALDAGEG